MTVAAADAPTRRVHTAPLHERAAACERACALGTLASVRRRRQRQRRWLPRGRVRRRRCACWCCRGRGAHRASRTAMVRVRMVHAATHTRVAQHATAACHARVRAWCGARGAPSTRRDAARGRSVRRQAAQQRHGRRGKPRAPLFTHRQTFAYLHL